MEPVFVESVSGVGKSTTAAKLCDAMNTRGYSASCYLEGDADNPKKAVSI
jgi:MoxR-like ATPase